MNFHNKDDEANLRRLFVSFTDAALHRRLDEALNLLDEQYVGVGMGGGIISGRSQLELVLCNGCYPVDGSVINFNIKSLTLNRWVEDFAVLFGEIGIAGQLCNGKTTNISLVQTMGAHRSGDSWRIGFVHVSPAVPAMERMEFQPVDSGIEEIARLKREVELGQNRLDTLVNTMPGGVLVITITDKIQLTHGNNWIYSFLGYSVEEVYELEKDNPFALLHPDDLRMVHEAIERMRTGAENVAIIYRLMSKYGVYRYVHNNSLMMEHSPEKTVYYGMVTDM